MKEMSSDVALAVVRFPGEEHYRTFAAPTFDGTRLCFDGLEISTWLNRKFDSMPVALESTDRSRYCGDVARVVENLRERGDKTVICRQICGSFSRFEPFEMATEYFAAFPDMFCFLFFHPSTGWWMGASPELLLEIDDSGTGHTRALAGTRRTDDTSDWSAKNVAEHKIVTDDICRRVSVAGDGYSAHPAETDTLTYAKIEHLCTPISIERDGGVDMHEVIGSIHPTAAVGGYPVATAIEDIDRTESFPRYFYGGTLVTPRLAYVVLRCVHFDSQRWSIYTGSGITADSDPADEWNETQAKAAPLLDILKKY